jgi:hypothetical protein
VAILLAWKTLIDGEQKRGPGAEHGCLTPAEARGGRPSSLDIEFSTRARFGSGKLKKIPWLRAAAYVVRSRIRSEPNRPMSVCRPGGLAIWACKRPTHRCGVFRQARAEVLFAGNSSYSSCGGVCQILKQSCYFLGRTRRNLHQGGETGIHKDGQRSEKVWHLLAFRRFPFVLRHCPRATQHTWLNPSGNQTAGTPGPSWTYYASRYGSRVPARRTQGR